MGTSAATYGRYVVPQKRSSTDQATTMGTTPRMAAIHPAATVPLQSPAVNHVQHKDEPALTNNDTVLQSISGKRIGDWFTAHVFCGLEASSLGILPNIAPGYLCAILFTSTEDDDDSAHAKLGVWLCPEQMSIKNAPLTDEILSPAYFALVEETGADCFLGLQIGHLAYRTKSSDMWTNSWLPVAIKADPNTKLPQGIYAINPERVKNAQKHTKRNEHHDFDEALKIADTMYMSIDTLQPQTVVQQSQAATIARTSWYCVNGRASIRVIGQGNKED
jgi:hypothetical protein